MTESICECRDRTIKLLHTLQLAAEHSVQRNGVGDPAKRQITDKLGKEMNAALRDVDELAILIRGIRDRLTPAFMKLR